MQAKLVEASLQGGFYELNNGLYVKWSASEVILNQGLPTINEFLP